MQTCFSGLGSQPGALPAPVPRSRCIRRLLLTLGAIVLLPNGQAAAQAAVGPTSAQPNVAADRQAEPSEKNGKVCQYEIVTGSRMKKRICYTPEQWAARELAAKALKREMDDKPISKDANGG